MANLKIFSLEDSADQRELLRVRISKMAFKTDFKTFSRSEELIEALKKIDQDPQLNLPDLLILDIHLQGENGLEVLDRIKGMPHWASIPVAVVSASKDTADKVKTYHSGAICFLSKPYDEKLIESILVQLRMTGRLKPAA